MKRYLILPVLALALVGCGGQSHDGREIVPDQQGDENPWVETYDYNGHPLNCVRYFQGALSCDFVLYYKENPNAR